MIRRKKSRVGSEGQGRKISSRRLSLGLETLEDRRLLAVWTGMVTTPESVAPQSTGAETVIVTTLSDVVDESDGVISLREAIDQVEEGGNVTFDASLSGGTILLSNGQLVIGKSMTIDAAALSERITIDGNRASRVFFVAGNSGTITVGLSGLIITGGEENGDVGGGIYNEGELCVTDSEIIGNFANSGGGIFNQSFATLTLSGSSVTGNRGDFTGGGIYNCYANTVTIIDSFVTDNDAQYSGGGIYNGYSSALSLSGSEVTDNRTELAGGGIFNDEEGTATLIDSVLAWNFASDDSGNGGGVYNESGATLTVVRSTIFGNESANGGGVYNGFFGNASLTDSVLFANKASENGGGIFGAFSSQTVLLNVTIAGNSARIGGGIHSTDGVVIKNSIVAKNDASSFGNDLSGPLSPDPGTNVIGFDPGFVLSPVFDSDGHLTNLADVDLSLSAESWGIDRGENNVVTESIDRTGNPRVVASWKEDPTVDLGAYEFQGTFVKTPESPSVIVTTSADVVNDTDGMISLREAILYANDGDSLSFDPSLTGKITLGGAPLLLTKSISIDAGPTGGMTIDALGASGVFLVCGMDDVHTVTLTGLTVTGGKSQNGGGIFHSGGTLILNDFTITGNVASDSGGGVYNRSGVLSMRNGRIIGNTATSGGGVYNEGRGKVSLENCFIVKNRSDSSGGGVYNGSDGSLLIIGSVCYANRAGVVLGNGGGIFNDYGGIVIIVNSSIAGNKAVNGGGIFTHNPLTALNSIWAQNLATNDNDFSGFLAVGSGNNLYGFDPKFTVAPVFDEEGELTNADSIDLTLSPESWGIDRGENRCVTETTDLSGNPRMVASWKEVATVDIGAYEYQEVVVKTLETPSTIVTTAEDRVDDTDGLISFREAIYYANEGETVTFDPSLSGAELILSGAPLEITKPISVDGSALGERVTIDAGGLSNVFLLSGGTEETPIELISLVITGGRAANGGGIHLSGFAVMTDLLITGNVTSGNNGYGGGIYNSGDLKLVGCDVIQNFSAGGGGIYDAVSASLAVIDSVMTGNGSTDGYSSGGAIYHSDGSLTISGSVISGNEATIGGGIYNGNGTVGLTQVTVDSNRAMNGGGIYSYGTLVVSDSRFFDNVATSSYGSRGGGIYSAGSLTLTNSAVTGNSALGDSNAGGGIFSYGDLIVVNGTIAGNRATTGGGVYVMGYSGGASFKNSIIAGNEGSEGVDIFRSDHFPVSGFFTLTGFTDWTESDSTYLYDPEKPLWTDPSRGDYSLSVGSRAINLGRNEDALYPDGGVIDLDLDARTRIVNGIVDLGAFEYQDPIPTPLSAPGGLTVESAGGNCHRVVWDGVTGGTGYQVTYSVDGADWRDVSTVETGCLVEGLGYGQTVTYRVKTLGDGVTTTDSDWSATVSLVVCPMDVDGDGLISASDASLISLAWLTRPGSDRWDARCDVNRDGIVSSADWSFLSANWLRSSTDDDLLYPPYRSPSLDESIFGSEWDGLF